MVVQEKDLCAASKNTAKSKDDQAEDSPQVLTSNNEGAFNILYVICLYLVLRSIDTYFICRYVYYLCIDACKTNSKFLYEYADVRNFYKIKIIVLNIYWFSFGSSTRCNICW